MKHGVEWNTALLRDLAIWALAAAGVLVAWSQIA